MSLTLKRLIIIAKAIDGDYGIDISFSEGLFILRVENSYGKSTCMNAVSYALGMEKALGQVGTRLPFPPSLTKAIEGNDGVERVIISSKVTLEIENSKGEYATLVRQIVGPVNENIIEIFKSRADNLGEALSQKYFLHREGDTTRELGFYSWLNNFIGWQLPSVLNYDGKEVPLYPSVFFPLWFVEQKKGWSSIQATTPQIFKIKDSKKRALEFILNFDVNDYLKRRSNIKLFLDEVFNEWRILHRKTEMLAARVSGEVIGLSDVPDVKFDPYRVDIAIKEDSHWISIQTLAEKAERELDVFLKDVKSLNVASRPEIEVQNKINQAASRLRQLGIDYIALQDEISYLGQQVFSTEKRISSLSDDKRKYEDLLKIGGIKELQSSGLLEGECPTCGQEYAETIVDMSRPKDRPLMSLDESLDFIKNQIKAFEGVLSEYRLQLQIKSIDAQKINKKETEIQESMLRLSNREIEADFGLIEENIRKKIDLENKIKTYKETIISIANSRLELELIYKRYKSLLEQRKNIPAEGFSAADFDKLESLRGIMVDMLVKYGFSSFDPKLVDISKETYLPTREGFDIGFDASASDGIRIIWSYLLALYKISSSYKTNHPGVLMFDEPRQQEANKFSFTELLKSASDLCGNNGQIIFATSEDESVLKEALKGKKYTLKSFDKVDGKILRKIEH